MCVSFVNESKERAMVGRPSRPPFLLAPFCALSAAHHTHTRATHTRHTTMWEFWRSRMSKGKTRHRRRPESDGEELTCVCGWEGWRFVWYAPPSPQQQVLLGERVHVSHPVAGERETCAASPRASRKKPSPPSLACPPPPPHSRSPPAAPGAPPENSTHIYFKDAILPASDDSGASDTDASDLGSAAADGVEPALRRGAARRARSRVDKQKLIIILVGLPGRGKTFLCNKLMCYLNW